MRAGELSQATLRALADAKDTLTAVLAATRGEVLVLDNVHRLHPGTLAATLGRLLTDRECQLPDGRRLVPQDRYDLLAAEGSGCSADEIANLVPVHPAFRVLATAEPPSTNPSGSARRSA